MPKVRFGGRIRIEDRSAALVRPGRQGTRNGRNSPPETRGISAMRTTGMCRFKPEANLLPQSGALSLRMGVPGVV